MRRRATKEILDIQALGRPTRVRHQTQRKVRLKGVTALFRPNTKQVHDMQCVGALLPMLADQVEALIMGKAII